eukprot:Tbor_TRINITY_DN5913_c1_g1::TRINITY_DN5913_c1_g1_i1::g.18447::m.18447
MEKKEEKIEEIKKQDEIEKRNKKLIMGSIKNNQIFNTRETKEIKENNLDKKRSPGKGRKRIGGEILDALADDEMDELLKFRRRETKPIKHWQGTAWGTEKRHREMHKRINI